MGLEFVQLDLMGVQIFEFSRQSKSNHEKSCPQNHKYFANSVLVPFTVPQVVLYEKQTDSLQTKCLQTAYLTIDLYKSKLVVRIISLFCLVENEYRFQLCKKSKRMSATILQWPLFRRTKICVFLCLIVCVSKNLIINHIYISRHL